MFNSYEVKTESAKLAQKFFRILRWNFPKVDSLLQSTVFITELTPLQKIALLEDLLLHFSFVRPASFNVRVRHLLIAHLSAVMEKFNIVQVPVLCLGLEGWGGRGFLRADNFQHMNFFLGLRLSLFLHLPPFMEV